jgi:iron complex outermembrane receptor protein
LRVDAAYKSEVFVDAENSPLLRQPDHAILNASAELRFADSGLSVRAGVDNITNRRIITAGYDASTSFGFTEAYYSPPRRYSITLAFRR